MRYLKRCFTVLLAAGLFVPPAFAHRVRTISSNNRIYSSAYTRAEKLSAIIDRNSTKTQIRSLNWANKVTVGGLINVDGIFAHRGWNVTGPATAGIIPNYNINKGGNQIVTDSASDISVTNANILIDAKPNRWFKAHVGLVYLDPLGPLESSFGVDEAYITISNFARYPFYVRVGKEFAPIGTHETPYPLTPSFTFLMTQTQATVFQLGYVSPTATRNGFFGTVFAFNSPFSGEVLFPQGVDASYGTGSLEALARSSRVRNFGAKIGYRASYRGYQYDLEASYLKDFRDTLFFLANERLEGGAKAVAEASGGLSGAGFRRAAVYSLNAYATRGMYDFLVNIASLTRSLDQSADAKSAGLNSRMWAYTLRGGYWFRAGGYRSKVQLGYERSGHAIFSTRVSETDGSSNLEPARYLPRFRYIVDYIVNVGRKTALGLQYAYSKDYDSLSNSGLATNLNRQSDTTIKVRLSTTF